MSIAIEKAKQASERFILVRMNPARFLTWASLGSGIYSSTPDVIINKIERNGTSLTKDSTWPTVNDHWYQDETTKEIRVKVASAPDSTTNILIVYYYLFYTGTKFRAISENPENSATTKRDWQPRILNYPAVLKSFDNIINGVFTISSSEIELINHDGEFQNYLGVDDSFYNKEVSIWLCITDETNIQKIFTGTVSSLTASKNLVSISIDDEFKKLTKQLFFDDEVYSYYTRGVIPAIPNLDPKAIGLPCPYIVGRYSRFTTEIAPIYVSGGPEPYRISDGNFAYCSGYSPEITVSRNRTWRCCRQNTVTANHGISYTVSYALVPVAGICYVKFSSFVSSRLIIGDTLKWINGATTYYGRCLYIGPFTYSSITYDVAVDSTGTIAASDVFYDQNSFAVVINRSDGTKYHPLLGRDYTLIHGTTTPGTNRIVSVFFVADFEANVGMASPLNPSIDDVIYRSSNSSDLSSFKHNNILKYILENSGLICNAASFSSTESIDDSRVMFQIPDFDEQDYDTYLKYVQDILSSTLGYIKLNDSGEVEYNLLQSPTSTNERSSFNMLDDGTTARLDYQDIATKVIAYNPHNSSVQAIEATDTPSITEENLKARYLHGLVNVNRFRHVLETINDRIDAHIGIKSARKATYAFETATEDIDTDLGDDLEINNKIVFGTSDVIDVKVISVEKTATKTRIEATDLEGL